MQSIYIQSIYNQYTINYYLLIQSIYIHTYIRTYVCMYIDCCNCKHEHFWWNLLHIVKKTWSVNITFINLFNTNFQLSLCNFSSQNSYCRTKHLLLSAACTQGYLQQFWINLRLVNKGRHLISTYAQTILT